LHLVSDATGTTLQALARACLAQFENISPTQKLWPLVRTDRRLDKVIAEIKAHPGPVMYTLVTKPIRRKLQKACEAMDVPCIPVLDPVLRGLSSYLDLDVKRVPGLQHMMDDDYFQRVEALDFVLQFDDGKKLDGLRAADVVLVGVSRTSKTPTSIYLARRGIKAANIPLVPGVDIPPEKLNIPDLLYIGFVASPEHLLQLRRTRLKADEAAGDGGPTGIDYIKSNDYLNPEKIKAELKEARALFSRMGWPIINVSKRSVEETAAEILALYQSFKSQQNCT